MHTVNENTYNEKISGNYYEYCAEAGNCAGSVHNVI